MDRARLVQRLDVGEVVVDGVTLDAARSAMALIVVREGPIVACSSNAAAGDPLARLVDRDLAASQDVRPARCGISLLSHVLRTDRDVRCAACLTGRNQCTVVCSNSSRGVPCRPSPSPAFTFPAADGAFFGGPIGTTVKVAGDRTNGALAICEMPVAAGFMVPPHTHRDVDEWSYVLEGRIGARVGDDEFTAEPGAWILKPRGIMHVFWSAGPAATGSSC